MTPISKRQRARFYIYKKEKRGLKHLYVYKNQDTFQKARQFVSHFIYKKSDILCYAIFHENFEININV